VDGPKLLKESADLGADFMINFLNGKIDSCENPLFSSSLRFVCDVGQWSEISKKLNEQFGLRKTEAAVPLKDFDYKRVFGWPSYWELKFSIHVPYEKQPAAVEYYHFIKNDFGSGNLKLVSFRLSPQPVK